MRTCGLFLFPEMMERGVRYVDDAEGLLIQETGGHPNGLQAALREIVRTLNREHRLEVTPQDVQAALDRVPHVLAEDFAYLWYRVPWKPQADGDEVTTYQQVLVRIALEPGISPEALRRRRPDAARLVAQTLKFYQERAWLTREGEGYRWALPLLSRWLSARAVGEGMLAG